MLLCNIRSGPEEVEKGEHEVRRRTVGLPKPYCPSCFPDDFVATVPCPLPHSSLQYSRDDPGFEDKSHQSCPHNDHVDRMVRSLGNRGIKYEVIMPMRSEDQWRRRGLVHLSPIISHSHRPCIATAYQLQVSDALSANLVRAYESGLPSVIPASAAQNDM
jgi:hypothetical protein